MYISRQLADKHIEKIIESIKQNLISDPYLSRKNIHIVGILDGGKYITNKIAEALGIVPEFIKIKSRKGEEIGDFDMQIGKDLLDRIFEKQYDNSIVIIADDILDTGRTIFLAEHLFLYKTVVWTAALIWRETSILIPTFYGLKLDNQEWVDFFWEKGVVQ